MDSFRRWVELLAPTLLALVVFGSMMNTRVTVVEAAIVRHTVAIEKMQESWLSSEEVRELKAAVRGLTVEVNALKVELARGR